MKKYRKVMWMLCVAVEITMLGACGTKKSSEPSQKQEVEVSQRKELEEFSENSEESKEIEGSAMEGSLQKKESQPKSQPSAEAKKTNSTSELFADMAKYQFTFCSGVGAWQTILNINADGSFYGTYSDSDMGDSGEGYPNGTQYDCQFTGSFTLPVKVNDYTYSVKIASLNYEREPQTEEIIEGVKYIYSTAYGLDPATDFYIYLPGAPITELPEGFCEWMNGMQGKEQTELKWYGLYNVTEEEGFSGNLKEENTGEETDKTENSITAELQNVESRATQVQKRLEQAETQTDINEASSELYHIWDTELNQIWGRLKETLDATTMDALTTEERQWISQKEQQIKDAKADYSGGSMEAAIGNQKEAELTKERVYQLAEYLKAKE